MLLLVRHGQTHLNAQGRFMGRTDAPLDDTGRAQANALAEWLDGRFDAVVSSPLLRARQTAAPLGKPAIDERLAELDQGRLEGMLVADAVAQYPDFFQRWQADPANTAVPGGESLGQVLDRARQAIDAIAAAYPPGARIVVVSHQLVISALLCWAKDQPLTNWRNETVPNGSLSTITSLDPPRVGIVGRRPDEERPPT